MDVAAAAVIDGGGLDLSHTLLCSGGVERVLSVWNSNGWMSSGLRDEGVVSSKGVMIWVSSSDRLRGSSAGCGDSVDDVRGCG